jgi:hypothetical protein
MSGDLPVVDLAEFVTAARADRPGFAINLGDGVEQLHVPDPVLWPDDALTWAEKDPVRAGRAIVGADEYERFAAAGGTAAVLWRIIRRQTQASPGESKPSAAS